MYIISIIFFLSFLVTKEFVIDHESANKPFQKKNAISSRAKKKANPIEMPEIDEKSFLKKDDPQKFAFLLSSRRSLPFLSNSRGWRVTTAE